MGEVAFDPQEAFVFEVRGTIVRSHEENHTIDNTGPRLIGCVVCVSVCVCVCVCLSVCLSVCCLCLREKFV